MKRALIGGFVSLLGSIWTLAISLVAAGNLTSEWHTPPGRFITTVMEMGMMPFFVISIVLLLLGIVIMVIEYFKKDN